MTAPIANLRTPGLFTAATTASLTALTLSSLTAVRLNTSLAATMIASRSAAAASRTATTVNASIGGIHDNDPPKVSGAFHNANKISPAAHANVKMICSLEYSISLAVLNAKSPNAAIASASLSTEKSLSNNIAN